MHHQLEFYTPNPCETDGVKGLPPKSYIILTRTCCVHWRLADSSSHLMFMEEPHIYLKAPSPIEYEEQLALCHYQLSDFENRVKLFEVGVLEH